MVESQLSEHTIKIAEEKDDKIYRQQNHIIHWVDNSINETEYSHTIDIMNEYLKDTLNKFAPSKTINYHW